MSKEHLAIYLNDHLAGSIVAAELLERLESLRKELAEPFADLRADIEADRRELESLIDRVGVTESTPRRLTGWLAEKATQLKLWADDDPGQGPLRVFEALELVALGIDGKLALWRALSAVAEAAPALGGMDYERLAQRAIEQRQRVERFRLEAAKAALAPAGFKEAAKAP
jgi:hypothetical protein